jgi:hypothetical protein
MMDVVAVQALTTAVVFGALEGWRRYSAAKDADARSNRLGANLGPRVEKLQGEMAEVRAKLGLPPAPPTG